MIIALIIIGSIIALFLLTAMLMGKKLDIECNITIKAPPQQIFDYIKFTKNHDNFSVWNMMDPDMKKEYKGIDGSVGFVYSWDSNKNKNVGAGEQEIKKIEEAKSIEYEIRFIRPMQSVATSKYILTPGTNNQTTIQWGFYSEMKFPMNAMKPLFKNMMGKALDKGLNNLKVILEKK